VSAAPSTTPLSPATLVIFGASGDLAHRSLWPALYDVATEGLLHEDLRIIGVAFDIEEDTFAEAMGQSVRKYSRTGLDASTWRHLMSNTRLLRGDFTDAGLYEHLAEMLHVSANEIGSKDVTFYLAIFESLVETVTTGLARVGYGRTARRHARLVLEKPFGHDLPTAVHLNSVLHRHFDEQQIFRMDHYLGKETVQNLLTLRFANSIFEPLWNRNYIDSVQITVAEADGIGNRAPFYEHVGALRDVLQNHMMQLFSYVAMEVPSRFAGEALRDEKVKVLCATSVPEVVKDVVRAQYADSAAGCGYLQEKHVAPDSQTETYVAMHLQVDNWRWAGTPFFLRTGKRLAEKRAEIVVRFKPAPHLPFAGKRQEIPPNELVITIQPDEGVALQTIAKTPGQELQLQPVMLDFFYASAFTKQGPTAYERLLHDALLGEPSLFMHADEVEAAWEIMQPVLECWAVDGESLHSYRAGSDGPREANALLGRHRWHALTKA
jgi:glucose-6-phosphate 1-dehydrogenase